MHTLWTITQTETETRFLGGCVLLIWAVAAAVFVVKCGDKPRRDETPEELSAPAVPIPYAAYPIYLPHGPFSTTTIYRTTVPPISPGMTTRFAALLVRRHLKRRHTALRDAVATWAGRSLHLALQPFRQWRTTACTWC